MKKMKKNKKKKSATKGNLLQKHPIISSIIALVTIIALVGGVILGYQYYQNHREIGTDQRIKATNGQTANGRTNWIKPTSTLASGHGNSYLFLTQLPKSNNGRNEFSGGTALLNNLILLLSSGQPKDINQAAALYTRNQQNYRFTSRNNRLVASVGQTANYYNNYFSKIKNISDYAAEEYQTALGKLVNKEVNDPISLTLIGSQILQPGQLELIQDPNSSFADLGLSGIKYHGTIQYHTKEDFKKIKAVNLAGTNKMFHPEQDAIKVYGDNFHALYISTVTDSNNTKTMLVYLVEDKAGKVHYWGNYYYQSPKMVGTFAQYQKLTKNVKPDHVTGKDINWSTFVDSLK